MVKHCHDPVFVSDPEDQIEATAGLVPAHRTDKTCGRQLLSLGSPSLHYARRITVLRASRGMLEEHESGSSWPEPSLTLCAPSGEESLLHFSSNQHIAVICTLRFSIIVISG